MPPGLHTQQPQSGQEQACSPAHQPAGLDSPETSSGWATRPRGVWAFMSACTASFDRTGAANGVAVYLRSARGARLKPAQTRRPCENFTRRTRASRS